MTEYKKLYNQIDKLNNKIKKLELSIGEKKQKNIVSHNIPNNKISSNISTLKSTLISYKICFPKESYSNKKYIGLKFDDNPNDYDSDDKSTNKNLIPFIKLSKSNIIINYNIQLELNFTPLESIICSVSLGIKTSTITDSKIRIIKGTKYIFDLASPNVIDNKFNISNNILYTAEEGDELCMIADFDFSSGSNCVINSKKSIIKLLFV
jgi:hypothetical protein